MGLRQWCIDEWFADGKPRFVEIFNRIGVQGIAERVIANTAKPEEDRMVEGQFTHLKEDLEKLFSFPVDCSPHEDGTSHFDLLQIALGLLQQPSILGSNVKLHQWFPFTLQDNHALSGPFGKNIHAYKFKKGERLLPETGFVVALLTLGSVTLYYHVANYQKIFNLARSGMFFNILRAF